MPTSVEVTIISWCWKQVRTLTYFLDFFCILNTFWKITYLEFYVNFCNFFLTFLILTFFLKTIFYLRTRVYFIILTWIMTSVANFPGISWLTSQSMSLKPKYNSKSKLFLTSTVQELGLVFPYILPLNTRLVRTRATI